jgi:hypothetical protein
MGCRAVRLAVLTAAVLLAGLGHAQFASAAVGDVRADLPAGAPGGVSAAFDGKNLYYTDRNGVLLHSMSTAGVPRPDVPIVGAVGLNALTYDVTHDFFWAVDSTGLGVYQLTRDGFASLQFALIPAVDLPGLCDVATGCSTVVSGLAYDATTDSLWYAPQLSQRIYHLNTAGQLLGYFDTNDASGSLFPDCATNGVSGLAAGADSLYVAAGNCAKGFRYTKSDTQSALKVSAFKAPAGSGDLECDNVTFPATVVWTRSVADGHLRAVEVAPGTCAFGGGVTLNRADRWMSGAGLAFDTMDPTIDVQHAFHLLCTTGAQPNNMVINWKKNGTNFSFHLETVDEVTCLDDFSGAPDPPPCDPAVVFECFNKIFGHGIGRLVERGPGGQVTFGQNCNNKCGTVIFVFTDRGEPNRQDITQVDRDEGELMVSEVVPNPAVPGTTMENLILDACGCKRANYQAHQHDR